MAAAPFNLSSTFDTLDQAGAIPHFVGWGTGHGGYSARKGAYSERLSNEIAQAVEQALSRQFPGITSNGGRGVSYATAGGAKSMDVAFPLDRYLGLGLSVKTVGLPERDAGYVHNTKRTMEEWTLESLNFHLYMPYSILVGVMLYPVHAGFDRRLSSSLWKAWHDFRHIAGRGDPGDAASRLERVFIGLYQPKFHPFGGPSRTQLPFYGMTRFFDVTATTAPTRGLPLARELTRLEEVGNVLREDFERRNPLLS